MAAENDNFEILVESAFEVESGGKKENLLVGLVSEVEIAQEVLSPVTVTGESSVHSAQKDSVKKSKREAGAAMQRYAYQSLLHLEKHTVELTDSLHQMCCLCSDGLSVHQQSLQDLHNSVDKCSKNLYTFISKLEFIQEHAKCLETLEKQIQSAMSQLNELENLFSDS